MTDVTDMEQRIQEALDAGQTLEEAGLAEVLATDPDAARRARELEKVNGWILDWGASRGADEGLDAIALRIAQRMDEDLAPIGDPTLPPAFEDEDSWQTP